MGWSEKIALHVLTSEIAVPLNRDKKFIEMWFVRRSIPGAHIFNLAQALGVTPAYLSDDWHGSKASAILPGGIYERDIERMEQMRQIIHQPRRLQA